ncbi:MAG: hypothetical protein LBV73_09575, partial [Paraburkholderia sp.]|nr:hypothetical protein [Paraburkholderia sp.]
MSKLRSLENLFGGRHFDREIIILCVRWYLRYKLSLHDLVEMMAERGLSRAHTNRIDASHSQGPVRSLGDRTQGGHCARRMECGPVHSISYPSYRQLLDLLSYFHQNHLAFNQLLQEERRLAAARFGQWPEPAL